MFEQDIKKQLLHKIQLPSNLAQNSHDKSIGAPASKNTSRNNNNKYDTPAAADKATPPDSSSQPIVMVSTYYNIVEDMKRVHANISLFKLVRIMG